LSQSHCLAALRPRSVTTPPPRSSRPSMWPPSTSQRPWRRAAHSDRLPFYLTTSSDALLSLGARVQWMSAAERRHPPGAHGSRSLPTALGVQQAPVQRSDAAVVVPPRLDPGPRIPLHAGDSCHDKAPGRGGSVSHANQEAGYTPKRRRSTRAQPATASARTSYSPVTSSPVAIRRSPPVTAFREPADGLVGPSARQRPSEAGHSPPLETFSLLLRRRSRGEPRPSACRLRKSFVHIQTAHFVIL
jgi:hypothetical protein